MKVFRIFFLLTFLWISPFGRGTRLHAEEAETSPSSSRHDHTELSKQLQNPVTSLINLPFEFDFNFKVGTFDRNQFVLDIQPVVPFQLSKDWSLVTRTILPIMSQPVGATDQTFGLSDLQFSAFFARSWGSIFSIGWGPIFQFPTATDETLGAGKFGMGPTVAFVVSPGPWVAGVLFNNVWSLAGDPQRAEVNQALIQPFINYNFSHGWSITSTSQMNADWTEPNDNRWLVPVGIGFAKTFHAGKQPMNAGANFFYNVLRPDTGPNYQICFTIALLFPRRPT